jgi:hypothetical protein
MSDMGFGEALRLVRRAHRMTQAELAAKAKLTRPHLTRIEGARKWPTHYARILGVFGFTVGAELMAAARIERERLASVPRTVPARCESCGSRIASSVPSRGRPRKRCASCAADKSAIGKAWRATHPKQVAAYNLARTKR